MSGQFAENDAVRALHRKVQWKGWWLWLHALGRDPLAFVDAWCHECHKPWPCPTITNITPPEGSDHRCTGCGETLLYCATEGDGEDSGADCCDACDHGLTPKASVAEPADVEALALEQAVEEILSVAAGRTTAYGNKAQAKEMLLTLLATRDAERDRARDAEARRVVERLRPETCREELNDAGANRCGQRAEFILWGKLLPREAFGPRCYDHAVKHTHHSMPSQTDQWAVYDLRPINGALAGIEEGSP